MINLALPVIGALGIAAGFLLITRVPLCRAMRSSDTSKVSIIIAARNEEQRLPFLLRSLAIGAQQAEVIVVDDHSSDATAQVALELGARLVPAPPLPRGWTGKNWACMQGALVANGAAFLFLDADTWFPGQGLERLLGARESDRTALSILPFHMTERPYEELSLFFNLMMAVGAGGFGVAGRARLFGQSLLISRGLYQDSGTHKVVRAEILENLTLADQIEAAGGKCVCMSGRGVLHMRMFPDGFQQLSEGWTKAFATGAGKTERTVLWVAVLWLTAISFVLPRLIMGPGGARLGAAALYVIFVLQIKWMTRHVGDFRWYTCILFPAPLLFFFALFARSASRRALGRQVTWRGRRL